MTYGELLEGLVEGLSLPGDAKPDADGVFRFSYGGSEFSLREDRHCNSVLLLTRVGLLPMNGTNEFMLEMLRSNYLGRGTMGGTFSVDDEGTFYLHMQGSLADVDLHRACTLGFPKCIELLDEWRHLVETYNEAFGTDIPPPMELPDNPLALCGPGFLRV